jgi:DNA-binding NarL/FixJ family response regulator
MITVMIADDHAIIRDGLKAMLAGAAGIEIVGCADNGKQVIDMLEKSGTDVILMDISMPLMNGIETTKIITEKYPDVKVIALTIHEQIDQVRYMLNAGVKGYVLKDAAKEELIQAILAVGKGKKYYSEKIREKLSSLNTSGNKTLLTEREKEILKLIADEYTNQQIADKLFLSVRTVDTHRRNLFQKLGVKNTAGLVKYAYTLGLV